MNRKISVSVALAITIIAMTVTFSITWIVSMRTFDTTVRSVTQLQSQYAKLAEIDTYVRNNYYGEIDDDFLFDRVAVGYMSGLGDRYSVYYTAEEYSEMMDIENGVLVGIGIEITRTADGNFNIARVYDGSPAARAGLQMGGRILSVDGEDARNISSVSAMHSRLRGEQGTMLSMVCQYGIADEASYAIQRINYTAPTVQSITVGDYAYIRVSAFTSKTYAEFSYAVGQAELEGAKGIVFDLRYTSGGLFRNAYDMIDLVCPRGTIAKSLNKTGTMRVLATSDDENAVALPMVALVNEATSGPAELFAASIRELAGGQVVGMRTAGRGTIQSTPQRLSDGSAVSVTIALLYTGSDETFDGTGLAPDVEVEGTGEDETALYNPTPSMDAQAMRALTVAQAMVREKGGDAGVITDTPASSAPDSSEPEPGGDDSAASTEEGGDESGAEGGDSSTESSPE